ncbi:nucleotide disphospho-sugar-binding domain-containing protein [Oscillospiraceae bacterium PP1C4]
MSKILMINLPFSGHTNPTLQLTRELVQRGHHVTYINAEVFRTQIEETGAEFVPYVNYPENPTEKQKKTMCFMSAYDTALSLQDKFDLLIYEMFFYPGIKIAQALGIPCVRQFSQPAWNQNTMTDATAIFKLSCKMIDHMVMNKKSKVHMDLKKSSLKDSVLYDKPDLNIVYVPSVFQPHQDSFDSSYVFAMPPMEDVISKMTIPYDKMKHPIIYISLGSIISNRGFCKECIRAFRNKEFSVILNTGKIRPESLRKISDNIFAYSFVPQLEVLKNADVFLTHCGMNSVNEALWAGVPMIAMPFVNDQLSNAKRITELGVGKRIRSFPSSSKEMYHTAKSIINDSSIYARCQKVSEQLKIDSFVDVVNKVENLLTSCN